MRATPQDLGRALDHAPVLAVIEADRADRAMHAASACLAGGFQVIAVAAAVPDALDLVRALVPRPDSVVGLLALGRADLVAPAAAAGAAFVLDAALRPAVGEAARAAGLPWYPGAVTPTEIAHALDAGAASVHLYPAGTQGGPTWLRLLRAAFPGLAPLVGGGIGADRLADWIAAGARAVALSEALYSPALLAAGDAMAVRQYAAAAHAEATRCAAAARRSP